MVDYTKQIRVDDVVVINKTLDGLSPNILAKVTGIKNGVVYTIDSKGNTCTTLLDYVTHTSDEQKDEYYTVTLDGVRYRFYYCDGEYYSCSSSSPRNTDHMSLLGQRLIKNYNLPVKPVDSVEDMKPPKEG